MAGRFSTQTVFSATEHISRVLARANKSVAIFSKNASRDIESVNKAFSTVNGLALKTGAVVAGAGVAGAAGMYQLIQPGIEFERVLASINAVAKPTAAQLGTVGETAKEVGADFGFSGITVAKSMEAMLKQGIPLEGVLQGISGAAAAANADGSELDATIEGLLATMAGMGMGADQLQNIADVMAKAGDMTAAGIGTLTQSMAVFGPIARNMNISIKDAVGQLAILQDAGLDASSAGTTLAAVYSKLAAGKGSTAKALKKLGLDVKDSAGNMKAPAVLMNEIFQKMRGLTGNVSKSAAITELVGLESQKALSNLIGAVESGKFDQVMNSLSTGVDGYSKSIAKIKQDSGAGDIKQFESAIESLRITIYGLVAKDFRSIVQASREWVSANKQVVSEAVIAGLQNLKNGFVWFKDNLPEIVVWLKRFGVGLAVFFALQVAVKGAQLALALYTTATWAARTATLAYGLATGALTMTEQTGTAAIVLGTTARWARNAATWAIQAATWAYNAAATASKILTMQTTVAEVSGTAARWARNVATFAVTASQWLYNIAMGAGTVAAGGLTAAILAGSSAFIAAAAPIAPLVLALGGLLAVIYAVKTAWDGLTEILGGDVAGTIGRMWDMGTLDVAAANDALMNEKAASAAKQVSSPQERTAHSVSENHNTSTVEIVDTTGKAKMDKPAPGVTLKPKSTGAP